MLAHLASFVERSEPSNSVAAAAGAAGWLGSVVAATFTKDVALTEKILVKGLACQDLHTKFATMQLALSLLQYESSSSSSSSSSSRTRRKGVNSIRLSFAQALNVHILQWGYAMTHATLPGVNTSCLIHHKWAAVFPLVSAAAKLLQQLGDEDEGNTSRSVFDVIIALAPSVHNSQASLLIKITAIILAIIKRRRHQQQRGSAGREHRRLLGLSPDALWPVL